MSQRTDNEELLRALAREGGRLAWGRLTYRGILAANRLIRHELARIGTQAPGWELVLTRHPAGQAEQRPGQRPHEGT